MTVRIFKNLYIWKKLKTLVQIIKNLYTYKILSVTSPQLFETLPNRLKKRKHV